jgi:hypothetical protein
MPGPQLHTIYSLAHELCVCAPPVRALPRSGTPSCPESGATRAIDCEAAEAVIPR